MCTIRKGVSSHNSRRRLDFVVGVEANVGRQLKRVCFVVHALLTIVERGQSIGMARHSLAKCIQAQNSVT